MPVAFTGKYRHLLENTGKYWKIEFTILELKTKPYTHHLIIFIWLISIIEIRDTNI